MILLALAGVAPLASPVAAQASPAAQAAPLTWADLSGETHPTLVTSSNDLLGHQIAIAPADPPTLAWGNPNRLAYCAPGGIMRTLDGGQTWSRVPSNAVPDLAASTPYPLASLRGTMPMCESVTLDPSNPDAFYAVFEGVMLPQDAPPPWFAIGYYTRDAGQSWQAAPPASDASLQFRGFVSDAHGVQALFAPAESGPPTRDVTPPVVVQTADGGQTWQETGFGCPAMGPCVRFGAPPSGIGSCNMHGYGQPLLVSADGGQTWASPVGGRVVNACQSNELAILSETDVLLLAPGGDELAAGESAPARLSRDGGRTFVALGLPAGPDPDGPFELKMLPDGRLLGLFSGQALAWLLLEPDEDHWCSISGSLLPNVPAPLRVVADQLWWLSTGPVAPHAMPYADLGCGMPLVPRP
jgi:hypothetical protein